MRWGLAHTSAQGEVDYTACGVVRCVAVRSAPELRTAWLRGQRGIVPLAGFYLWRREPGGHHQPHYVRLVNRPVFGVAALWERAEANDGDVIESCALITVDANPLLAEIANATGQMPGILARKDYDTWLSCGIPRAQELLQPYPQTRMVCHPVAPHVNHLEFDEPGLIKPANR